jgi:hypothetical protein
MGINAEQLRYFVIVPTLKRLEPAIEYSVEAVDLLCMTAAHESLNGTYLKQVQGPAMGIYQMEPDTHDDIWEHFLAYNGDIAGKAIEHGTRSEELITNLRYATIMARVHYYRVPELLPKRKDFGPDVEYILELALYAKRYYNTALGKAAVNDYYNAFMKLYGGMI